MLPDGYMLADESQHLTELVAVRLYIRCLVLDMKYLLFDIAGVAFVFRALQHRAHKANNSPGAHSHVYCNHFHRFFYGFFIAQVVRSALGGSCQCECWCSCTAAFALRFSMSVARLARSVFPIRGVLMAALRHRPRRRIKVLLAVGFMYSCF